MKRVLAMLPSAALRAIAWFAGACAIGCADAAPPAAQLAGEPAWPQFRGPARDGICRETGLLKSWPEAGPRLLWKRENLGRGYSSPVIAGDTLFLTGDLGSELAIFALNLDGTLKWQAVNGAGWEGPYPGSRASCTLDGDRLFHLNAHGRLACLASQTGTERWALPILERFHAETIKWGISECLLVDGNRLIVTPGGPETLMAAVDRETGNTVWKTGPLRFLRKEKPGGKPLDADPHDDCDRAGYASPLLFEMGARRLIAGCSARHLFLVDADSAKLLWTFPVVPARWEVIGTMPVLSRDRLIFSAPDFGTRCFQVTASPESVEMRLLWEAPTDNCHGGYVVIGDRLLGSGYRRSRDWVGLDLATGETRLSRSDLVKGAALWADERLYALSENGIVTLLNPAAGAFETVGRMELPKGAFGGAKQSDVWAHPVIHRGRLYLRNHDVLACYDVKEPAAGLP